MQSLNAYYVALLIFCQAYWYLYAMLPSLIALLVALSVWLTPAPTHARGLLVYYGNDHLAYANADYRGYSLREMRDACGLSLMSPADLGKIVWVRLNDGSWYGPCSSVDVSARVDFYANVYIRHEIAEVTSTLRDKLQFIYGSSATGEIYIGLCPPNIESKTRAYAYEPQPLKFSGENNPYMQWPRQDVPIDCNGQRR